MPLRHIPLDDIEESNLVSLITGGQREGKRVEFKRDLHGRTDSEKAKFLKAVTSLANTQGGDLIYGVEEANGVASVLVGLDRSTIDSEVLRLESTAQSNIDPRIPGLVFHPVDLASGRSALVVRVPSSWAKPHMVTLNNSCRFYSRNSAGSFLLDVRELRSLFVHSERLATRIKRFRDERLAALLAGESPIHESSAASLVVHVVPFGIEDPSKDIDPPRMREMATELLPISQGSDWSRFNADGFLLGDGRPPEGIRGYVQLFRSGAIEAVDNRLLEPVPDRPNYIPGPVFERDVLAAVHRYMNALRTLGVEPPLVLLATLLNVEGFVLSVNRRYGSSRAIDRPHLFLPDVLIESYDGSDPAEILRPIFDSLWNAAGFERCGHYSDDGEWAAVT